MQTENWPIELVKKTFPEIVNDESFCIFDSARLRYSPLPQNWDLLIDYIGQYNWVKNRSINKDSNVIYIYSVGIGESNAIVRIPFHKNGWTVEQGMAELRFIE